MLQIILTEHCMMASIQKFTKKNQSSLRYGTYKLSIFTTA